MPFLPLAVVVLVAAVALVAPHYVRVVRRELSRGERMERVAAALGLDFSRIDPAYPGSIATRFPFELFSRGVDQTCENVIRGTVDGVHVVAFDFLYAQRVDSDGTPEDDLVSEPIRHSCAVTTIAGRRPHIVIEAASTPRDARADGEPVELEWGDFNARYRVISLDRGFAPAVLDVDLMAWLVDHVPDVPLTWEMQRDHVLCRASSLDPERVPDLVRALVGFARRVGPGASD